MFNNFKKAFARPKILGLGEEPPKRSATPLELFFDLAFVVAITHLVTILTISISFITIIYVVIKFIAIILFWTAITKYNQYFEDNTLIHRIIILIAMIPVLFLSIGGAIYDKSILYFYLLVMVLSRIYIILIWFRASHKKKNEYLAKLSKVHYVVYSISMFGFLASAIFLNYNLYVLWVISVIILISIEILLPIKSLKKLNKNYDLKDPNIPVFDRALQMERITLLIILILGEGLVGVSELLTLFYRESTVYLLDAALLLVTTFLILCIFIDYYSSHIISLDYFYNLNYLNLLNSLGTFLIISGFITLFEHYSIYSQIMIGIGLIVFSISNILIDNHRDKLMIEKYEYGNNDIAKIDNESFRFVKYSFVLNIVVGTLLLLVNFSIYEIVVLVNAVLLINVGILIKKWL